MTDPEQHGKAAAYGGVVVNAEGNVLLRKPKDEYDGYAWTFAKGRPKPGQTPQETALCEVLEETGWKCEIVGEIPGSFLGGTTSTAFYLMKPLRDTGHFDWETEEVVWVSLSEARQRITQTRNAAGRKRDLAVLQAVLALLRASQQ